MSVVFRLRRRFLVERARSAELRVEAFPRPRDEADPSTR